MSDQELGDQMYSEVRVGPRGREGSSSTTTVKSSTQTPPSYHFSDDSVTHLRNNLNREGDGRKSSYLKKRKEIESLYGSFYFIFISFLSGFTQINLIEKRYTFSLSNNVL